MSDETVNNSPASPRGMRAGWAAAIAGVILAACLCGFAAGSILISAGVSAYSGWSGVAVTRLVVTVAFVSGPTYTPLPTYTLQPTYTPQPTHTPQPTYTFAPTPPVAVPVQPTAPAALAPTQAPAAPPDVSEDLTYEVADGDTIETVAEQFGADVVPIIVANQLDPTNPTLKAGETIIIPFNIAPLCVLDQNPEQGEVIGVFDGDTIEVTVGGQNATVRYIGIDAPDLEPTPAPFSSEAQSENQTLVEGLTVGLAADASPIDDADRLLRYVTIGDTFVNYDLVRRGFARAAPAAPNSACDELFALAEEQARTESLGMWAQQVAPEDQNTPGAPAIPTASPQPGDATPYTSPEPYESPAPAAFQAPPSSTPAATSSLGFNCQCRGTYVWGNFETLAQANTCSAICAAAATRQAVYDVCEFSNDPLLGCAP